MNIHRTRWMRSLGLVLVFFAATALVGQSFEATVVGTVADPTGARLPGVSVTVTEDGTGQTKNAVTGDDGAFTILQLRPASYTIKFEANGFKPYQQNKLVLETNQTARLSIVMQVGGKGDEITVTAAAQTINTDTSKKGETIVNRQVEGLPLNGREFTDLAMLVPGVYPRPSDDDQGQGLATSGTRTDATNFTLDGVNNRSDRTGGNGVSTSLDAIQEFNVSTSTYTAEYGRQAGAQVTVVTKSGTNNYHGSLFEYLRSDIIDARNFMGGASALRRNQFGGTLGGKIIKDRTFFFASYEGYREAQSETAAVNAPNADWLGRGSSGLVGDFRDLLALSKADCARLYGQSGSHACQIGYNTGTGTSSFHQFPVPNVIPTSMISPAALAMLKYIPTANDPNSIEGYTADGLHYRNRNKFLGKIDHRLTNRDSFYVRWARQSGTEYDPFPSSRNYYPHFGAYPRQRYDSIAFGDTHMFSATTINEFRFGWYNQHNGTLGQNQDQNYAAQLGIPGVTPGDYYQGFPSIRIDGYPEMGDRPNYPYVYLLNNYQWADTLTLVRNTHTIKIGADIARNNYNELGETYMRGDFRFRGKNSSYGAIAAPDPWAFADFLMGKPDSSQIQIGNSPADLSTWPVGIFAQDDWKATPYLTLNLGLRWDLFTPMVDAINHLGNFIPSLGQVVLSGDPRYPKSLVFTNWRNISPRLGFALRPFKNDKTVMRGGGGVFYSQEMYNVTRQQLAQNYPFMNWQQFSRDSSNPDTLTLSNPWPSSLQKQPPPYGADPHGRTPQIFQYNLTVERELAPDLTWEVGYVGSIGHFLGRRYDANQGLNPQWNCSTSTDPSTGLPTKSCKAVASGYPFPQYVNGTTAQQIVYQVQQANSNYHALQTSLRRRSRHGLTMLASYTFSRMIDDASATNDSVTGSQKYPQNNNNMKGERGLSDLNRSHQFTASANYDLPVGRGRTFLSGSNGLVDALIGGWQINAMTSALSGRPYTPQFNSADFTSERPNLVGDPLKPGSVAANPDCVAPDKLGGLGGYVFNPCAFARPSSQAANMWTPGGPQPTMPVYGNLGRNTMIGPWFFDVDTGMSKNFKVTRISEQAKIQFRIEAFNLFNHPNFQIPNYLLDQPNVAQYKTMANSNRVFQFALKLLY